MANPYNDQFNGKEILITGGVGFIGSNLAIELVRLGANVTLVDSMIPAYGARLENIKEIKGQVAVNFSDVRDPHSLRHLVQGKDAIFSLAGQLSHIDSMNDPFTDLDINCASQLSLLECCRSENKGAKVVFASTRQLYGRPQYLPVDENHPQNPVDVNGINKLAAELYYSLYHQVYGIRTVSLRLTNTYGPRMDLASNSKGFTGIFVRLALNNEPISLFGDGTQKRDFNYIDDVVDALLLSCVSETVDGEIYNLAYPTPYSLLEFVQLLQKQANFEYHLKPFPEERKAIDIGDYYGSAEKFIAATGWSPKVDLEDGLQKTMEYFRNNP